MAVRLAMSVERKTVLRMNRSVAHRSWPSAAAYVRADKVWRIAGAP
jgi:hypothetical protein